MADQTQGSIEIAADPAEIMAVIGDYEAYPSWAAGVKAVTVLERDGDGRATQARFEVAQGPVKVSYTLAYDYAPKNGGVSWTFVDGNGVRDVEGSYVLAAAGKGATKVTYRARVDLAIPIPGFLKRQGEKIVIDTALKGLKKRVESARR